MTSWPWDLNYVTQTKLEAADVSILRSMCYDRDLGLASQAQKATCVRQLLKWKKEYKEDNLVTRKRPRDDFTSEDDLDDAEDDDEDDAIKETAW